MKSLNDYLKPEPQVIILCTDGIIMLGCVLMELLCLATAFALRQLLAELHTLAHSIQAQ